MMSYQEARQAIADAQLALAELRSHLLFKRVMALALELHYRPDQPRAPAGTPIGGQWIDDPSVPERIGASPPRSTVVVAATTRNFNYACKALNLNPKEATRALHAAKETIKLRDDCTFDLDAGNIIYNGEVIGNLRDSR
jgi:hypothetical protein